MLPIAWNEEITGYPMGIGRLWGASSCFSRGLGLQMKRRHVNRHSATIQACGRNPIIRIRPSLSTSTSQYIYGIERSRDSRQVRILCPRYLATITSSNAMINLGSMSYATKCFPANRIVLYSRSEGGQIDWKGKKRHVLRGN